PARSDPPGGERRGPHLGQALPPRARALHPRRRAPTPTPDLSPEAGSAMRLATIDLGTNSVRLLVADISAEGWWAVEEAQRVTRLGEGQAATGGLAPLPMARTAATVADYVQRAEALGASRVRITATSAVREAANRAEFVAMVESATGESLEVLSGEDEARLTLLGARSGLPDLSGRFVLFDIGGGSTEFVVATGDRLERALSLRLGV